MTVNYLDKVTSEVYKKEASILKGTNSETLTKKDREMLDSILGKMGENKSLSAEEIKFLDAEVHQYMKSNKFTNGTGAPERRDRVFMQLKQLELKEGTLGNHARFQERCELIKKQFDVLFKNQNSASLSAEDKARLATIQTKLAAGEKLSAEDHQFIRQESGQFIEKNKGSTDSTLSAAVDKLLDLREQHRILDGFLYEARNDSAADGANSLFQFLANGKKPPVGNTPPSAGPAKPPVENTPPSAGPAKPPATPPGAGPVRPPRARVQI